MINTTFFQAIKDKLAADVAAIKFVELWNNQLQNEDIELPFNMPAVFVEYAPMEWETLGLQRQAADIDFALHVVTECFHESGTHDTAGDVSLGLQHLTVVADVSKAMHGYSGAGFSTIKRTYTQPDNDHGNVYETIIGFKCRLIDDYSLINYTRADPQPNLDIEI